MAEDFLRRDRRVEIDRARLARWEAEDGHTFLPWWPWFTNGMRAHISETVQLLWQKGITRDELRRFRPTVNRQGCSTKSKCTVQRECIIRLKNQIPTILPFLRRPLERWKLDIPVGHRASRALAAMREAWTCTPT